MEAMEEFYRCLDFSSSDDQQHNYEDPRCEFDAPRYHDFSEPETCFEAQQAERWFDFAATYPPSPFIPKLKFGNNGIHISVDEKMATLMNIDHEHVINSICMDTNSRAESVASTSYNDGGVEEITRKVGKEKSHAAAARSSSTLMKPTASYLAKQRKKPNVNHSRQLSLRPRKTHDKYDKINPARSSVSHIAAKRPKLDAACYNMHKVAAATCNSTSRHNYKVTIPREPVLETSLRAQRRSSKNSDESVVSNNSIIHWHSSYKAPRH